MSSRNPQNQRGREVRKGPSGIRSGGGQVGSGVLGLRQRTDNRRTLCQAGLCEEVMAGGRNPCPPSPRGTDEAGLT